MEELQNLLHNLIAIGTICETQSAEGKALARVNVCGRITDFLPVMSFANSYKRHFTPARVGEQVLVFNPYGESNGGFIVRAIFNKECKESEGGNDKKEVIVYEDDVSFSYDTETSTLNIGTPKQITINCTNATIVAEENIDVTCTNAIVKADTIKCDSPSIDLGLGGKGVVTTECICAFTGSPHPHGSENTRSKI